MLQQEAGHGLVLPRRRQGDLSSGANSAAGIQPEIRYEPSSRLTAASSGGPFLGVEAADDQFENVRTGHDALEGAVFVMHQSHMHGGVAQDRDDVPRIEKFGNDRRLTDQLAHIGRLPQQVEW